MEQDITSFSELASFRQCPMMWWLTYKEGWVPPKISDPLTRGTFWHVVLETHYRDGEKAARAEIATARTKAVLKTETLDLVEWMYDGYAEHYREIDRKWKVVAIEQRIHHQLPPPSGVKVIRPILLSGAIDLVVKEGRFLWLVDHKSHKDIPTPRKVELDDQMPLYAWLMRQMGKPVTGAIYNVARAYKYTSAKEQPLEERFKRIYISFSDKQLENVARDAYLSRNRAQVVTKRAEAERQTGDHCLWRCSFTEPCLAGRRGVPMTRFLKSAGYVKATGEAQARIARTEEGE